MKFRIFSSKSIKLIIITILVLLFISMPAYAVLWGNKVGAEDLQRIITELRIYDDSDFSCYNDIFRLYYHDSKKLLNALNKKIEITQQAMKILDADIKKEELGNLTYGRYILNAINEKELVEIGLKAGSSNQANGEYFSKLSGNLADWDSQLSKFLLTKIIEATCTAMGAPALSIGISTLGLFCDLSIIGTSINKLNEKWYEKAFWSYILFRNEPNNWDHIDAWKGYAEPFVNHIFILSPEKQKKAREAIEENFKSLWDKYEDHIVNNKLDKNFKTQQRESLKILLLYALGSEPHTIITSPLKITPPSPYQVGDIVNAEFTIANQGTLPIKFSVLTIGGRDNNNQVADFSHQQNIILKPIESYNYKGTLTLNKVKNYHFFCTYQTPDGEWNTNVDVGSKLTDEDREEDIYVNEKIINQPPDPPANLAQFESDGETKIPMGDRTDGHNVILKAKVNDPDGDKAKLEVELRRLDEYEGKFDEDKGGLQQSDLFENNSEIMTPIYELSDGDYHWRARAIDEHGLVSEWVSFGGNPDSDVDFNVGQEVVAPILTSPLKITSDPPYYVGDTINAEFSITNKNTTSITFTVLTVGGGDPNNHVSDFTIRQNITLEPSEPYNYQGTLTLNKVGDYHFFCTYQTPDGNWNTNVDLGSELTDEDRIKEIVVIEREAEKEVVYVAEQSNHRIQKFTSDGKFITKWGKGGSGDGEFILPRGIAIDSQGNVYVVDANNCCIQKFTSEGKFITKWGKGGSGDGEFILPRGIAIDSQGNVYVVDANNCCIQKFTSEGKFITDWGKRGSGDGEFNCPIGIAIDSQGNVYVADSYNERIQKFTSEGKFITKWWGKRGSGYGEFGCPQGIAIDSQNNVYVADSYNERIQKFTSEGKYITDWGKEGSGDGEFDKPQGIAIDSQDNIYITDWNNHRIQKFTSEGKFITQWGKEGSGDGEFDYPTGIAISRIYETEELEEKEEEKPSIAPDTSEELYIEWDKTFGGNQNDYASSLIQTTDGGYALVGSTESKGAGKEDAWVIKLDDGGNIIWDKTFGGNQNDTPKSIIQNADSSYILSGFTNSNEDVEFDAWVIKLDDGGNIIWDKTFGGSEEDGGYSLIQTTDGEYVITGSTSSKGAGKFDAWVIKLDDGGNIIWDKTFGGSEDDLAYSLVQSTDGGYVIAGSTKSKGAGKNDAWIIKLDNRGNIEWDKTFGGSEDDLVHSLIQTSDNGYIVAGGTSSKGAGKYDAWVIKLDDKGNIIWDKTFGGSEDDGVNSLIQTSDNGYIVAGGTSSKGAGKYDAWVIKLSSKSIETIEEEAMEVSISKNYFPLDEGKRWEYQFFLKTGEDWNFGPVSKMSGERIITNFPQRELKGEKVTPQQVEDKVRGSSHISFWFYIEDQSGVYEFAHQKPGQIQPKIAHDFIIKYPIKIGYSWQETETSEFEPEISIPVESTIESINEVVTVPAGTFEGCLKIKTVGFAEKDTSGEWLPKQTVRIDREWYKWFAPGIGIIKVIVKEEKTITGIAIPTLPSEFVEFTMQLKTFK